MPRPERRAAGPHVIAAPEGQINEDDDGSQHDRPAHSLSRQQKTCGCERAQDKRPEPQQAAIGREQHADHGSRRRPGDAHDALAHRLTKVVDDVILVAADQRLAECRDVIGQEHGRYRQAGEDKRGRRPPESPAAETEVRVQQAGDEHYREFAHHRAAGEESSHCRPGTGGDFFLSAAGQQRECQPQQCARECVCVKE